MAKMRAVVAAYSFMVSNRSSVVGFLLLLACLGQLSRFLEWGNYERVLVSNDKQRQAACAIQDILAERCAKKGIFNR